MTTPPTAPAPASLPPVLTAPVGGSPNGSPSPGPGRKSEATRRAKTGRRLTAASLVVVLIAGAGVAYWLTTPAKAERADLSWHKVRLEPLQLTVVERGALESADNREVTCRVKAGANASNLRI